MSRKSHKVRIAKKDFTRFRNDFVLFSKILPLGVFACDTKAVDKRSAVSETRDVYADFLRTLCPRGHSMRTVFVFYLKCPQPPRQNNSSRRNVRTRFCTSRRGYSTTSNHSGSNTWGRFYNRGVRRIAQVSTAVFRRSRTL